MAEISILLKKEKMFAYGEQIFVSTNKYLMQSVVRT
jgi:hypothetical protein